jgi:hypothetical protein
LLALLGVTPLVANLAYLTIAAPIRIPLLAAEEQPFLERFAEDAGNLLGSPEGALIMLAALLSIETCILSMAISLMPWAAAGERMVFLFSRCLKWAWWASSLALPITATLNLAALASELISNEHFSEAFAANGPFGVPLFTSLTYLCAWWALWVAVRGLVDYAGPAVGPGWEPIEPVCQGCGYRLAYLSPEGICPECAKPVTESLPGGDRPGADSVTNGQHGSRGWLSRTWQLLSKEPLRHNAPRQDSARSRKFCAVTVLLMMIPLHVAVPMCIAVEDSGLSPHDVVLAMMLTGALFGTMLLEFLAGSGALCFWGAWLPDRKRDPRIAASTALYCTALFWPFVLGSMLFVVGGMTLGTSSWAAKPTGLMGLIVMDLYLVLGAIAGVVLLSWWGTRVRTHLRSVHYTNS